jgi:hypothetical protein
MIRLEEYQGQKVVVHNFNMYNIHQLWTLLNYWSTVKRSTIFNRSSCRYVRYYSDLIMVYHQNG